MDDLGVKTPFSELFFRQNMRWNSEAGGLGWEDGHAFAQVKNQGATFLLG